MIAICANCSCSRGRRTGLLAALQFEYREADRTTPTEAPAWWSPRPNSCQPLLVLQRSSSCRRRGRDDAWLDRLWQGIISAQGCRHCFPAARVEVCPSALAAGFGSTKTGQSRAVLFRRQHVAGFLHDVVPTQGGGVVLAPDGVRVNGRSRAHGGVSQARGGGSEVHAVGQQQARVAVPQQVERCTLLFPEGAQPVFCCPALTELPQIEKPPRPAPAVRLPLCASRRPRTGARRSRRGRAVSPPSARGSSARAWRETCPAMLMITSSPAPVRRPP